MSGGHFDYKQFDIQQIIDELEQLIRDNGQPNEWGDSYNFSDRDIIEFRRGLVYLQIAHIYAQRIDWYVSGDDGEESFHERLREELDELRVKIKSKKPVEKWLESIEN